MLRAQDTLHKRSIDRPIANYEVCRRKGDRGGSRKWGARCSRHSSDSISDPYRYPHPSTPGAPRPVLLKAWKIFCGCPWLMTKYFEFAIFEFFTHGLAYSWTDHDRCMDRDRVIRSIYLPSNQWNREMSVHSEWVDAAAAAARNSLSGRDESPKTPVANQNTRRRLTDIGDRQWRLQRLFSRT